MHAWAILGVCAVVVAIATVTGHDPLTTTAVSATVLTALAVALALRVVVAGRRHCRAIHPDGAEIRAGWGPDALRLVSQHGEEMMVYRHLVRLDPLDDWVAVRTAWGAMSVLPRAIADDEALAVVRDHRQVVGAV